MTAPGMSELTPEQTAENERIFGARFLSIQQRPENMNRKQRRAHGERKHSHGIGTRAISQRHLADQQAVYAEMKRG